MLKTPPLCDGRPRCNNVESLCFSALRHVTPAPYRQRYRANLLALKYWTSCGCKKANARCGIFCEAFGIISLGSDLFCLLTGDFLSPSAAEEGGCGLTFSAKPASHAENENCGTWWHNLPLHVSVDKAAAPPRNPDLLPLLLRRRHLVARKPKQQL